jgi:glycosyltransferase involved in cell wall biosynthesis
MEDKKNILILLTVQFGYHTDTYMYCKYLDKSKYNVSYYCFDMNLPKTELPGVSIVYVKMHQNKTLRYLIFIEKLWQFVHLNKFNLIFHVHTKFSLFIRMVNLSSLIVLDIRTGDLNKNRVFRRVKNMRLTLISFLYPNISIISESLAKKLNLSKRKTFILPLGGELQNIAAKDFSTLHLLYVGTLNDRNIHETIYGLSLFMIQNPTEKVSYDIVGEGSTSSLNLLNKAISETNLQSLIFFHGRKNHTELIPYFEKNNIGVIYIPQTQYYDNQPSTKLYESFLAGMPVIATNTFENRIALKDDCGVITEDNPVSFCNALAQINRGKHLYNSEKIKEQYIQSSWNNIVKLKFEKYIDNICNK